MRRISELTVTFEAGQVFYLSVSYGRFLGPGQVKDLSYEFTSLLFRRLESRSGSAT